MPQIRSLNSAGMKVCKAEQENKTFAVYKESFKNAARKFCDFYELNKALVYYCFNVTELIKAF